MTRLSRGPELVGPELVGLESIALEARLLRVCSES